MPSNTAGFLKIYPAQCEKQKQDAEQIFNLMEDFVASAVALPNSGAMGYTQFIEARDRFRTSFLEMTEHYRYVEEIVEKTGLPYTPEGGLGQY